jgi:hypothetical protein
VLIGGKLDHRLRPQTAVEMVVEKDLGKRAYDFFGKSHDFLHV